MAIRKWKQRAIFINEEENLELWNENIENLIIISKFTSEKEKFL